MIDADVEHMLGPKCVARACGAVRQRDYIMCAHHWQMVPVTVQRQVIRTLGALTASVGHSGKLAFRNALNAAKLAVDLEQAKREERSLLGRR